MLTYKDAKSLVICGDIHGEFVPLVYEMCVQYGMRDTLVIVAGADWRVGQRKIRD